MNKKRLLVLSSPSGGGKSTIAAKLMLEFSNLKFSVSATTRKIRPGEEDGKQYHFMSIEDFENNIEADKFVEYENLFGNYYGTLRSEVQKSFDAGNCLIFDVDVKGAMSIKKAFPDDALLIFIAPPTLKVLETRLRKRSTETEQQIQTRLSRAEMEMSFAQHFDKTIINDILDDAINETIKEVAINMEVRKS